MGSPGMPTKSPDAGSFDWLYAQSSAREKVLEHLFVGELLRWLWRKRIRDVEVLRSEVDSSGYDVVIDCNGFLRHIQLKSSHKKAKAANQKINIKLAAKPSGCVVLVRFDPETMALGPFLWLGGHPGDPLPDLGAKFGRHTKGDSKGHKAERPNIRVISKGKFTPVPTMEALTLRLFGTNEGKIGSGPASPS
jgi:hypothetical protein